MRRSTSCKRRHVIGLVLVLLVPVVSLKKEQNHANLQTIAQTGKNHVTVVVKTRVTSELEPFVKCLIIFNF